MDAGAAAATDTGVFKNFIGIEHLHGDGIEGHFQFFTDNLAYYSRPL